MTGEIPFYGHSGTQLWTKFAKAIQEWADGRGISAEIGPSGTPWTGVAYRGRGRVVQVRVNANSLRCYPLGVEPQERFAALRHEPSKCSKSWKKRYPSMFTIEKADEVPMALEVVAKVLSKVSREEPLETVPPMMIVTPSS